jgi:aryl-alcohol dehydrogenase-like predicted oxidoreductase
MPVSSSRRGFLAAGLALPAAASAAPQQAPSSDGKVAYRQLGKTGVKVTPLSFGCMTTSDGSVIEHAADAGIVHFDTARSYQGGNNERMVGAALKSRRSKVVISSKTQGKTAKDALADLDTSLRELGTDYLDIWYLHMRNDPAEVTDDLLEAQRSAKQAGKIRFAGVSTHFNMDRVLRHLAKEGQTDVALTTYNFAMRSVASDMNRNTSAPKTDMTAVVREARESGMGIIVMKTLAGGTTRVQRGDRLYGAAPEALVKRLSQPGAPLAAIKWALRNPSVDTAIVCMTDHDQLLENLRAMSEPYTPRDEALLTEQLALIGPIYCRMCGACTGVCEKGVPVPDMLRFLSYAEGYGQFAMARERFLELPQHVRDIRCGECGSCSVDCPNGVRVRERVGLAQELFG